MSSTNSVGSSTSSSATTGATESAVSQAINITPSDFLTLITTELKDQNPLQPTDPTQFLGQLEQMSEVSSMQGMQTSLSSLQTSLASSQMANGAAMIGTTVLAPSSVATLDTAGASITGALSVPSGEKSVTVTISNATTGAAVNTLTLTPASSGGLTNFTWNGTTSSGATAPAGQYTIAAVASDGAVTQTLTPLIPSKVTSVSVDSSTSALDITTENGTVPLSSVVALQ